MNYIIKFEEGTLINFKKAIGYYGHISEDLAHKFHVEFWNKIDSVKEKPLHYQVRYKSIRIAHIKSFPYGIHFIVDGKTIRVLRILHHKQYYT